MEQFSLEKYLENQSRKVATRRGNPVRIICTDRKHGKDDLPIVFLEGCLNFEFLLACRKDGRSNNYDTQYDLFFADEEEKLQSIEIPFGAKDSEFIKDEYYIPEGCEARIEGRKVIIEKIQKEEKLTEFEKAISEFIQKLTFNGNVLPSKDIKGYAKSLLDLARKEILKDFPEWKRNKPNEKYIHNKGYYLTWNELENLPKEE